jgi:Domain of unknown function (DUF4440)
MTAIEAQLNDLDRRWTEAEVDGDTTTLDCLATDDFTLVGPAGFVLDKPQWLERYRGGGLHTSSLRFEHGPTRIYGDTAVTIAGPRRPSFAPIRSMASSAPRASPCASAQDGYSPGCTSARSPVRRPQSRRLPPRRPPPGRPHDDGYEPSRA